MNNKIPNKLWQRKIKIDPKVSINKLLLFLFILWLINSKATIAVDEYEGSAINELNLNNDSFSIAEPNRFSS